MRHLIETIEDEDRIVQVIENLFEANPDAVGQAVVRIGSETDQEEMDAYSIVLSPYQLGDPVFSLGLIWRTPLAYGRAAALTQPTAAVVNRPHDDETSDPSVAS